MKKACFTELDTDFLKTASSSETMAFLLQVEEAIKGEVFSVSRFLAYFVTFCLIKWHLEKFAKLKNSLPPLSL